MPSRTKIEFQNDQGEMLTGLLEQPDQPPHTFAIFAHCFSCSKDTIAASRISQALANRGFAVLRFDFTGLGSSEGDFANTNFSSNVNDLVSAAEFLKQQHQSPTLLVGHSLGGTAVLSAATQLADVKAVITIGAPSTPAHVVHHFDEHAAEIKEQGQAKVTLAGREFTIKSQFIEDVQSQKIEEQLASLGKALLVYHSPLDETVAIDEAAKIYTAAKHPKSFISLDKADHLLTRKEDAEYVATTASVWAARYLSQELSEPTGEKTAVDANHVLVKEHNKAFARAILTNQHQSFADEPIANGGSNLGPDPYELLLSSLGACTSMTIRVVANNKKIPLEDVEVTLSHAREYNKDCGGCDEKPQRLETIERTIKLTGELSEEQRQALLKIADRCPVHKTLTGDLVIKTDLA